MIMGVVDADVAMCVFRVTGQENSLVWYQQVLGWINRYSGVGGSNPDAIALEDTVNPVVDLNP